VISIVLTTFNRPCQLLATLQSIDEQSTGCQIVVVDDGTDDRTQGISLAFDALYLKLRREPSEHYRNQARPLNVGIRHALGETIILQNAECKHVGPNVIKSLISRVTDGNAIFARVTSMNEDGTRGICYCGTENPRPYFFCGAIRRINLMKLRGFDEDYQGYGYEDDDMADRLRRFGISFEFTDIEVEHQWHPPAGIQGDMKAGAEMFKWKQSTGVERNLGRGWGTL
jgi:glycosyltransferase involved in cell wall biosynthesis